MCRQLRKRSDGGRGRQQLSIEEMMSTCSIPPHEAENLIKKIDGFESRLMALESRSASTYFPEVIISSVNKNHGKLSITYRTRAIIAPYEWLIMAPVRYIVLNRV